MKLCTFTQSGVTRIGVVLGDKIADLAANSDLPLEMVALLAAGPEALREAERLAEAAPMLALQDVRLEAPILRPPKILALGRNYAGHAAEIGKPLPEHPVIFNKQVTSITGPHDSIHLPRVSKVLDYEGELGIVIGRRCRHVPKERASEVIAGLTVVNDVSIRDWQLRSPTMTMGKSFDTHCPVGPWIVTPDEFSEPYALELKTWVNGELRQSVNTDQMAFDVPTLIEFLSTAFTLEPGDIIATGTPSGVGILMKPPQFLKVDDVVKVGIEGIGEIENVVVDEPTTTTIIE